jgi:hypothetical protein
MDQGVDKDSICQACGKNELVFAGPNTTEHFCQWLFSGENEGATVIAHNFKGYDSLPILEYLYLYRRPDPCILDTLYVLHIY